MGWFWILSPEFFGPIQRKGYNLYSKLNSLNIRPFFKMIRFNFLLQNLRLNLILIFLFMPCLKGWCSELQTSEAIDTVSEMTRHLSPHNEFCSNIFYDFKNSNLLELAVTHNLEDLGTTLSLRGNERLEFLGDAVLEFGLRLVLWKKAPIPFREHLTTTCSSLAANATLATICDHIGG